MGRKLISFAFKGGLASSGKMQLVVREAFSQGNAIPSSPSCLMPHPLTALDPFGPSKLTHGDLWLSQPKLSEAQFPPNMPDLHWDSGQIWCMVLESTLLLDKCATFDAESIVRNKILQQKDHIGPLSFMCQNRAFLS